MNLNGEIRFWMIETFNNGPLFWDGQGWAESYLDGIWFLRKEDAEKILPTLLVPAPLIVEHIQIEDTSLTRVLHNVLMELSKAERKHRHWPVDPIHGVSIIEEEVGEAMREAIDYFYSGKGNLEYLSYEIAQSGAMALRMLLFLETNTPSRRKWLSVDDQVILQSGLSGESNGNVGEQRSS